MAESDADLMMKFVQQDGSEVLSESTLDVAKGDKYLEGFRPIVSYDEYSNFFEVTGFSFAFKVKDDETGSGAYSGQSAQRAPVHTPGSTQPHGASQPHGPLAQAGAAKAAPVASFARWRSASDAELRRGIGYPASLVTFTFDRTIDGATPLFFQYCCN